MEIISLCEAMWGQANWLADHAALLCMCVSYWALSALGNQDVVGNLKHHYQDWAEATNKIKWFTPTKHTRVMWWTVNTTGEDKLCDILRCVHVCVLVV